MDAVTLPLTNESGYYEIRLESIGGLGANLCGSMLGELGVFYLGCNSASFSSYGSEKTGTPVKTFVRYCGANREIRVHSPVEYPHLLGIFHSALLRDPYVLNGCSEETIIVLNTQDCEREKQSKVCSQLIFAKFLYLVDAQKIAIETHSRINMVMLGAMAKAMGFVTLENVYQICRDTLGKKYPDALHANLEGIRRGYEEVVGMQLEDMTSGMMKTNWHDKRNDSSETMNLGYRSAPIGGINPWYGNSVISDLSPSRQGYIPIFVQERCINCAMCDSTCPDMVFQFEKGSYKGREMMVNRGLDYYHCKGCLRCVAVCPTQALVRGLEEDYSKKPWFLANQSLLREPDYYEKAGPDGYITSESFLTEKRVEGGEV